MHQTNRNFDTEAATWDEQSTRVRLAQDIADAMQRQIPITSGMDALDLGCGTGLLSFHLQPLVRSITGIDNSPGMLDVFNAKVAAQGLTNISSQLRDLDKGDTLSGQYHLIVSSMTLHHIREFAPLFAQFYRIMAPGGFLGLADLDLDDGQFHEDSTGVFHPGFDRGALRQALIDAGFVDVAATTAAEVEKKARNGEQRRFTVLLMTGRKL